MASNLQTIPILFQNKAGLKLFYPRVVKHAIVSTEAIAREIGGYSSLSSGDVKTPIDNLVTCDESASAIFGRVSPLYGFGSFRITMEIGRQRCGKRKGRIRCTARMQIRFLPAYTRNPKSQYRKPFVGEEVVICFHFSIFEPWKQQYGKDMQ